MAVRKKYLNWGIGVFVLSVFSLIFPEQVAELINADAFAIRVAAAVMTVYSLYRIVFEYFPVSLKSALINLALKCWGIFNVVLIILCLFTAENKMWQYSLILYLVLSLTAFVLQKLQQDGDLKAKSNNDKIVTIILWCIFTYVIFWLSYRLFESPFGFFQFYWWISFVPVIFVLYVGYSIIKDGWIYKIAYSASVICLAAMGIMYFEWLPSDVWSMFILFCIAAIFAVPLLCYICVKNYPNLDGTASMVFLLLIMKSADVCLHFSVVQEHLKNITNYGV